MKNQRSLGDSQRPHHLNVRDDTCNISLPWKLLPSFILAANKKDSQSNSAERDTTEEFIKFIKRNKKVCNKEEEGFTVVKLSDKKDAKM